MKGGPKFSQILPQRTIVRYRFLWYNIAMRYTMDKGCHSVYSIQSYAPSTQQAKACNDILRCRTAALGSFVFECEECGHIAVRYNSCRNRHCPSCQGVTRAVWVDQRSKDILNAPYYFHVVFTVPQQLHPLIYQNQALIR